MALVVRPEPTPNPNAMRLALPSPMLGDKPRTFAPGAAVPADAPWVDRLLAIPGVVSVFGMRDFLTITKSPATAWDAILPTAVAALEKDLR
jgi:hypothetical protein